MTAFYFRFVATTGEFFETTITASTYRVALIKMKRERTKAFGDSKIWTACK